MVRSLLVIGVLLVVGSAVWIWAVGDEAPTDAANDTPATIGRMRDARGSRDAPGTVLPDGVVPRARTAADPKPLAPTRRDGPAATSAAPDLPTRSLAGTVRRLSDDSPLPGVRVAATSPGGETVEVLSADDPPGAFVLAAVPLDVTELTLLSTGPWPQRSATHALEPDASDTQDVTDLVLRFDSGFAVSGRVTDENDAPIPGALVEADRRGEIIAGPAGRFSLMDIAPEEGTESLEIGARAPWYQRVTEPVVVPHDPASVPTVHIRLVGSGALEGVLSDDRGDPVPGAEVTLEFVMTARHGNRATDGLDATADENGRYRIDHVPPGRYIVQAGPPFGDHVTGQGERMFNSQAASGLVQVWITDITVVVGEATRLDVALPAGAKVGGRITDAYGAPIAGVGVLLEKTVRWPAPELTGSSSTSSSNLRIVSRRPADGESEGETVLTLKETSTTTDAQGEYLFRDVTPGEKLLTASDSGGSHVTERQPLSVTRGRKHTHDIVLQTGVTMRSQVVDAAGDPVEGASVQVQPTGTQTFDSANHKTTDAMGGFELTGLQPTTMRLVIYKSGYLGVFEDVDTTAPKAEYVLLPSPSVNGRVLDAERDEPITNFTVAVSIDGSTSSNQSTFEGGIFKLDIHSDELATVSVSVPGYIDETLENIRPSDTVLHPLEFRLHPRR